MTLRQITPGTSTIAQASPSTGGFGEGVSGLLDIYVKCLKLWKTPGPKRHRDPDGASRSDARSWLRASLRTDRAQMRQAYASKRAASGDCLGMGGRKCRSAVPFS